MYWSTPKNLIASTIHEQEANCCACEKEIKADDLDKYFDQLSGKYIHKNCKPKYKLSDPFFPVVFHNLSKHDIHLLIT